MDQTKRKDLFKFVSKLTDLLGEYDLEQLENFKHMSEKQFPIIHHILIAVIDFEKEVITLNVPQISPIKIQKKRGRPKKDSLINTNNTPLFEILMSKMVFPKNKDLGIFSEKYVNIKVGWNWDSRENIVNKIVSTINQLEIGKKQRIIKALQDMYHYAIKGEKVDFFSHWENIIKEGIDDKWKYP